MEKAKAHKCTSALGPAMQTAGERSSVLVPQARAPPKRQSDTGCIDGPRRGHRIGIKGRRGMQCRRHEP